MVHICHSGHNASEVSLIVTGSCNCFQSYQESFCLNLKYHLVDEFYRTDLNPAKVISGNHTPQRKQYQITTLSQRGSLIGSFPLEIPRNAKHRQSQDFIVQCKLLQGSQLTCC